MYEATTTREEIDMSLPIISTDRFHYCPKSKMFSEDASTLGCFPNRFILKSAKTGCEVEMIGKARRDRESELLSIDYKPAAHVQGPAADVFVVIFND